MRSRGSAVLVGLVAVAAGLPACAAGGSHSTVPATPLPVTRVAGAQLAAHLGAGVPRGWAPVDFGDARVWVPSEWYPRLGGSCIPGRGRASVGAGSEHTLVDCDIPQSVAATQEVEIAGRTTQPRAAGAQVVHGYRVLNMKSRYSEWALYDIPTLGVSIATRGSLGTRVLATLGPSALAVALDAANRATPPTWRPIAEYHLALRVPANWTVRVTTSTCASRDADVYVFRRTVGPVGRTSGPGPPPVGPPTGTTVWIYQLAADDPVLATEDEQLVATMHHGSTTVGISWVRSVMGPGEVLDLRAHRAGSRITDSVMLDLGRNGAVPGAIIGSIRARASNTPAASSTPTGA